jgi:hypothetical protein
MLNTPVCLPAVISPVCIITNRKETEGQQQKVRTTKI